MKLIYVILDGAGDRPNKELGNKTPLEAAKTPNLDKLASKSKCGLVWSVGKGIAPESDTAVVSLLGYSVKNYCGRGPLEALGAGIKIKDNELALRANFATVKEDKIINRRAGRTLTTKEGRELAKELNKKVKLSKARFIFKQTIEHRGVLILKSKQKLSSNISNIDPGYVKKKGISIAQKSVSNKLQKCKPLDKSKAAKFSADLINEFVEKSQEILKDHKVNLIRKKKKLLPANAILLRDAGDKKPNFKKIKKRWAAVVGMPLEQGIAKAVGMNILDFKYPELKNYKIYDHLFDELKAEIRYSKKYLKTRLKDYDAFYLHFKETDIPGHDGLPKQKKKMIELIDKEFFSELTKLDNTIICVTADHSTPCKLKAHSKDPVPVLLYIPNKKSDKLNKFAETYCKKGSIRKTGVQLFRYLLKELG